FRNRGATRRSYRQRLCFQGKDMRFAFAFALALAALAPSAIAQPTGQTTTRIMQLDLSGPNPAVSVSINGGAPEMGVVDTGACGSVINLDRAQALNLPHEMDVQIGSPAGGTPLQGFMTTLTNVIAGGVAIPSMRVAAVPTSILHDRT